MSLPRLPLRQRLSLRPRRAAPAAPAATGTVYEPGQAPQPYHAPQYAKQAAPAPVAGATATPSPARSRPPSADPRRRRPSPRCRVAGGPNGTAPGASAPAAPKQRRVGLGVAAAIVAAALIGGASGAGITALITNNQSTVSGESAGSAQNIVVNDSESVNQITAVAAKASPSVVTISVAGDQGAGTGSGIILSEDGYVLTNTHVVTLDGATGDPTIQVKTNDGHLYEAELIGTDPLSDLAVIKLIDASGLTPLEFADSDELNVGDTAIAIGAPLGLAGTVTNGIVSALNRSIDVASSAAPTTPDDSQGDTGEGDRPGQRHRGEPVRLLLRPAQPRRRRVAAAGAEQRLRQRRAPGHPDRCGDQPRQLGRCARRLRGQAHRRQRRDPLGRRRGAATAGNIGVGFAVPSNLAERIANEIIENGAATHGLLGATVTRPRPRARATSSARSSPRCRRAARPRPQASRPVMS